HRVALVEEHDDVGNTHLPSEQDVLARLRHGPVHGAHHQDGAVHLRSTGDHVLDVVRVARAIHVGIVALVGRILHVTGGNRQDLGRVAPPLALRSLRHLVVGHSRRRPAAVRAYARQRGPQRGLAVVHVANRANVAVRLRTIKFRLGHCGSPSVLERPTHCRDRLVFFVAPLVVARLFLVPHSLVPHSLVPHSLVPSRPCGSPLQGFPILLAVGTLRRTSPSPLLPRCVELPRNGQTASYT